MACQWTEFCTCALRLMHVIAQWCRTNTLRESELTVYLGRKILRRTEELELRQQRAGSDPQPTKL